jgi:hypothetical protein
MRHIKNILETKQPICTRIRITIYYGNEDLYISTFYFVRTRSLSIFQRRQVYSPITVLRFRGQRPRYLRQPATTF